MTTSVTSKKQNDPEKEKIIDLLFSQYNKSLEETKSGQNFPQWLTDEQLEWIFSMLLSLKKDID